MLRAMRMLSCLVVCCSFGCYPAAKVTEVARTDVGTEQTRATAMLESASGDEAKTTGLAPNVLQDDAWVVEAGTHHTCVAFVSRTPAKLDLPMSAWTVELDGAPIAPDERDSSLHDYAFVTSAPPATDRERTPNVAVHRAIVCGPPHPDTNKISLVVKFRVDSIEWYERFEWSLR